MLKMISINFRIKQEKGKRRKIIKETPQNPPKQKHYLRQQDLTNSQETEMRLKHSWRDKFNLQLSKQYRFFA